MNKKTIYIVVAIIVVVLVVGVAGVILLGNNGSTTNPTPTPTPPATVVGASALTFNVNQTTGGATVTYQYTCKNFNSSTEVIRVDIPGGSSGNYSYIINAGDQTSWSNANGGAWTKDKTFDSTFAVDFTGYANKLAAAGSINDLSYTSGSDTITIYCVAVNPTIADSLFATT
jgi:hypothetical protein